MRLELDPFEFRSHVWSQRCLPGGLLLPPQGYPSTALWGMLPPPNPHNPQFYNAAGAFPGNPRPQAPAGPPIGSHNQFTPLQVNDSPVVQQV